MRECRNVKQARDNNVTIKQSLRSTSRGIQNKLMHIFEFFSGTKAPTTQLGTKVSILYPPPRWRMVTYGWAKIPGTPPYYLTTNKSHPAALTWNYAYKILSPEATRELRSFIFFYHEPPCPPCMVVQQNCLCSGFWWFGLFGSLCIMHTNLCGLTVVTTVAQL